MSFLLDTNVCIALMNGNSEKVRSLYAHAVLAGIPLATSSICMHELWYGVEKSSQQNRNSRKLRSFIAEDIEVLNFSNEDALAAAQIRAELERKGTRIGEYDTLIAGQALARQMTLVTANTREFHRVQGLQLEDWTQ
ncbi:type II toxin-antitoxin system tRNA(fMet)-specific endonuclease VapC [Terracidiphilus gabretensis]|uniref:type II toxin-antitoxin system tRNA(fMet)-specific endonuclease VapC n=1 Tax=Terracidiphilus gabretensis TaxID=1577687 RepID=UPI00071BC6FE|nr:type II toxin-antitoxin system VapC family toxin [Terracidiphilus gabretensis]